MASISISKIEDLGSSPSQPAIFGLKLNGRVAPSEGAGCEFESRQASQSCPILRTNGGFLSKVSDIGRKLNWTSSGVLTRWMRVRAAPGRLYPRSGAMVSIPACGAGDLGSSPSPWTTFDAVAKTERRRTANPLCAGSIPARVSIFASVAQRLALPPFKRRVVGSNPTGGTKWPR